MRRATMGLATVVAAATVVATLALAAVPAGASRACAPVSRQRLAAHLTAPCDGATVRRRHAVVFAATDPDGQATVYAPYLNLETTRTLVHGHLAMRDSGDGIIAQMSPVSGHPRAFTYIARREPYPGWWDNRPGTYYVQVEQVDARSATGVIYGPITTVRVP